MQPLKRKRFNIVFSLFYPLSPNKKKGRVALELKDKKRGFKRIEKHESEVHEFSDIN